MAPGVGLVLGEVPKPILRGGKIAFRQRFLLCSCNCSGFCEKWLLEQFWCLEGPETYFEGWENSVQTAVPIVFLQL